MHKTDNVNLLLYFFHWHLIINHTINWTVFAVNTSITVPLPGWVADKLPTPHSSLNALLAINPFANTGPSAWNTLPLQLCQAASLSGFKRLFKTHLFKMSFKRSPVHWPASMRSVCFVSLINLTLFFFSTDKHKECFWNNYAWLLKYQIWISRLSSRPMCWFLVWMY